MNIEREAPLTGELAALVAAEQRAPALPEADRARILARVVSHLPPPGNGPSPSGEGSATPVAPAGASQLAGSASLLSTTTLGALVVGGLLGSAVTWAVLDRSPPESPPSVTQPVVPTPPPPAPVLEQRPDASDPTPSRSVSSHAVPEKKPATRNDPLGREQRILERARTAMGQQRYEQALAAIEAHEREFTRGRLVEERIALRVLVLVGLDRRAEAEQAGRVFLQRFPHSIFSPHVRAALEANRQRDP